MKTLKLLAIVCSALLLWNCKGMIGEEVGRIETKMISTEEDIDLRSITIDLNKGDKIWFWTDIDMEYDGNLALNYKVELIQGADSIGFITLNPMDCKMTMNSVGTTFGNHTNTRYKGRMDFYLVPKTETYTFKSMLISDGNATLKLKKADLVLKK